MLGTDSAIIGVIFFHLGVLFKKKWLLPLSKINGLVLLAVFLISWAVFITLVLFCPTFLLIAEASQGDPPFLWCLYAIIGIVIVIALSVILEKIFNHSNFIEFISRNI